MRSIAIVILVAALLALSGAEALVVRGPGGGAPVRQIRRIDRNRTGSALQPNYAAVPTIPYVGGPIMTAPINVYFIHYGVFTAEQKTANDNMVKFAKVVGGSNWWNVMTHYYDKAGTRISPKVNYIKTITCGAGCYTPGTYENYDALSEQIIRKSVGTLDTNAIYFITLSPDVIDASVTPEQGYCGYHTYFDDLATKKKYVYSVIIHADSGCGTRRAWSQASTFAHELAEAASDPYPMTGTYGWYLDGNQDGGENGDICQPSGSDDDPAVVIGGQTYYVQPMYDVIIKGCTAGRVAPYPQCAAGGCCLVENKCAAGKSCRYSDGVCVAGTIPTTKKAAIVPTTKKPPVPTTKKGAPKTTTKAVAVKKTTTKKVLTTAAPQCVGTGKPCISDDDCCAFDDYCVNNVCDTFLK